MEGRYQIGSEFQKNNENRLDAVARLCFILRN